MLGELGIPVRASQRHDDAHHRQQQDEDEETKTDAVIELITPPRPIRHTSLPPAETKESESVTLDLTTPTPPSTAKQSSTGDASRRRSIVDLVSPDGSASEPSQEPWLNATATAAAAAAPAAMRFTPSPTLDSTPSVRTPLRRLLDAVDEEGDAKNEDDDDDERVLLPLRQRLVARRPLRFNEPENESCTSSAKKRPRNAVDQEPEAEIAPTTTDSERLRATADATEPTRPAKKSKALQPTPRVARPAAALLSPTAPTRNPKTSNKKTTTTTKKKEVQVAIVAMQQTLAESDVGRAIAQALETNSYNNRRIPSQLDTSFSASLPVIQWERRRSVDNDLSVGSVDPVSDRFALALHCAADTFLGWVDDKGIDGLVAVARQVQKMSVRLTSSAQLHRSVTWSSIIFIVEGMDRALIERKKNAKKKRDKANGTELQQHQSSVSTFSDLHELTFQLFMDTGVHTKFTCDSEATAAYVALVTRELLVAAQRQSSQEEFLESVPRVHSFRVMPRSGSTMNPFGNTWLRMLQMIPGVSEDKAQSLLNHFPTFASLMAAYRDVARTQREKEELLADKLSDGRMESALSKRIFHIFSSDDPAFNV
ncbi:hypothetical protein PINS_up011624 [Pythium insidiosum]|nr:hypothetical protein PINS_up011624 [Pythium insidiosum]